MLEARINQTFGDEDPKGFASGWWSGILSAFFGLVAFGAVLCLHFPQLLSTPEMRAHYPMPLLRMAIQAVIVAAIFCGVVSAMLRRKKILALTGMLYLVSPGFAAPAPLGAALMAAAGIAWGVYSLRGRKSSDPLAATAGNFWRATPFALVLSLLFVKSFHASTAGVALAIASGALTSGIGYAIWYAALPGLSAMRAATVQLLVPPMAALAGVFVLSEAVSFRLALASAAICSGAM